MFTVTEAAEQIDKSRSTVLRAIKTGKLSARRNDHGDYEIEPSELFRAFEPAPVHDTPSDAPTDNTETESRLWSLLDESKKELESTKAELADKSERLREHQKAAKLLISPEDFENKENKWKQAIEDRKQQMEKARADFAALDRKRKKEIAALEQQKAALESRGFIARLLNKPVNS